MYKKIAIALLFSLCQNVNAAEVVVGTNMGLLGPTNYHFDSDNLSNDYSLGVDWGPYGYGGSFGNGGDSGIFDKVNKYGSYQFFGEYRYGNHSTFRGITMTIAEGINIYLASYGVEFSNSTLLNSQFPVLLSSMEPEELIDVPFGDFYLAITKGRWGVTDHGDVYGWAHLRNTSSGLEMLGNAVAYGTTGIYVGTTNMVPVPEAETYAMMLAGLGLVGAMARRRRQAQT